MFFMSSLREYASKKLVKAENINIKTGKSKKSAEGDETT